MLISDRLILIELQKSGSSALVDTVRRIVGGTKDNAPLDPATLAPGKPVIAAIRDPWSWYLSLWSDGCLQKGELYERLTNPRKWRKVLERAAERRAARAAGRDADPDDDDGDDDEGEAPAAAATGVPGAAGAPAAAGAAAPPPAKDPQVLKAERLARKLLPENFTPERARDYWYADPDNPEAFREWLRAMIECPPLRKVLDPDYAKSPIGRAGGLMTYRYFTLFTRGADHLGKTAGTLEALKAHDAAHGLASHFVRNDKVGEDLAKALEACGVVLDATQRAAVLAMQPVPPTPRPHPLLHYYDPPTGSLVYRRERFIVERFDYLGAKPVYNPPEPPPGAAGAPAGAAAPTAGAAAGAAAAPAGGTAAPAGAAAAPTAAPPAAPTAVISPGG